MISKFFESSSKTIIALFLLIIQFRAQNLICNGDFQNYYLPGSIFNQKYAYILSNYSCWYNKNGLNIQVKRKMYPPVTSTAQLVLLSPPSYSLCQKITLKINYTYQLNFTLVNSWTMIYSTAIVTLNNKWLVNLTAYNQFTVIRGGIKFKASQSNNILCFDSVFEITNKLKYVFTGPCLDNITLLQIGAPFINTTQPLNPSPVYNSTNSTTNSTLPEQAYFNNSVIFNETTYSYSYSDEIGTTQLFVQMFCETEVIDSDFSKIVFMCNYQNIGIDEYLKTISKDIRIYFENQEQKSLYFTQIQLTSMQLEVRPSRSYILQRWSLLVPSSSLPDRKFIIVRFKVYVDGSEINFHLLTEHQVKIVKQLSSISEILFNALQLIYLVLKATFFSYFLLDMISFWNLSLMYNFLNISTVPLFSKYFLEMLSKVFFKLTSIVEWIIQRNPQLNNLLHFSNEKIRQSVNGFKNGFAWFGNFGFSSHLLKNNIQQIFILFLLLLKIGLLSILPRLNILRSHIMKRIPKGKTLTLLFLQQCSGLIIYAILSAASTILDLSFLSIDAKTNSIFQILLYFFFILLPSMLFLYKYETLRQKEIKKVRIRQKSKVIKGEVNSMKSVLRSFVFVLQYIPYVIIPSTIILNTPLSFLIVNLLPIFMRLYYAIKFRNQLKLRLCEKVYLYLSILVWATHHGTYCLMYAIELLIQYDGKMNNEEVLGILKYCGFTTIFTILIGGGLELLKFAFNFLAKFYKIVKMIGKKCCKNRIAPQQKRKGNGNLDKKENAERKKENIKVKLVIGKTEAEPISRQAKSGMNQDTITDAKRPQKDQQEGNKQMSRRTKKRKSIKQERHKKYYQFLAKNKMACKI